MKGYVKPIIIAIFASGGAAYAANDGRATKDVVAPHLKLSDVKGKDGLVRRRGRPERVICKGDGSNLSRLGIATPQSQKLECPAGTLA